jgi:hypothetical protein
MIMTQIQPVLILLLTLLAPEQAGIRHHIGKSVFHVPARPITKPPGHHWFGYYDKLEFDPQGRYVLSNRAAFEGRSPLAIVSG